MSAVRATVRNTWQPRFDTAAYIASFFAVMGIRMLATIAGARLLPKEDIGWWNLLLSVPWYFQLTQLGVVNAMNREVPICIGRGDVVRASTIARTALWWTVAPTSIAVMFAIPVLRTARVSTSTPLLVAAGLYVLSQALYSYWQVLNTASGRIRDVIRQQAIVILLLIGLVVPGAMYWGLVGFIGAHVAAFGMAALIGARWHPVALKVRVDAQLTRELARVGLPLMLIGVFQIILLSLDRWLIAAQLGTAAVGSYTLAALVSSGMQVLPQAYSQLYFARMGVQYGRSKDEGSMYAMVVRQSRTAFMVALGAAMAISLILAVAVPVFLPRYENGVVAATILAFGFASLSLASGGANFLNMTGRYRTYMAVQLSAIVTCVPLILLAMHWLPDIATVAAVVALVVTGYGLAIYRVAISSLTPAHGRASS